MNQKEVNLVGYWNGDEEDPDITFNTSESDCYYLCNIKLTVVPQRSSNCEIQKLERSIKKAYKGAKGLDRAFKNLGKKLK